MRIFNNSIRKSKKVFRRKKINYKVIYPSNNYEVVEEEDNRNLNKYDEEFELAFPKVSKKLRIDKVKEKLELLVDGPNFKTIIRKVEEILDEVGEI